MQAFTTIQVRPEELAEMVAQTVAELLKGRPQRKHAYTINEVAEQIGYCRDMISRFIHEGKKARSGLVVRLKAREITKGNYRITPEDLDEFLSHF